MRYRKLILYLGYLSSEIGKNLNRHFIIFKFFHFLLVISLNIDFHQVNRFKNILDTMEFIITVLICHQQGCKICCALNDKTSLIKGLCSF